MKDSAVATISSEFFLKFYLSIDVTLPRKIILSD